MMDKLPIIFLWQWRVLQINFISFDFITIPIFEYFIYFGNGISQPILKKYFVLVIKGTSNLDESLFTVEFYLENYW